MSSGALFVAGCTVGLDDDYVESTRVVAPLGQPVLVRAFDAPTDVTTVCAENGRLWLFSSESAYSTELTGEPEWVLQTIPAVVRQVVGCGAGRAYFVDRSDAASAVRLDTFAVETLMPGDVESPRRVRFVTGTADRAWVVSGVPRGNGADFVRRFVVGDSGWAADGDELTLPRRVEAFAAVGALAVFVLSSPLALVRTETLDGPLPEVALTMSAATQVHALLPRAAVTVHLTGAEGSPTGTLQATRDDGSAVWTWPGNAGAQALEAPRHAALGEGGALFVLDRAGTRVLHLEFPE